MTLRLTWLYVCGLVSHSRPLRSTARCERHLCVWQQLQPWPVTDSHYRAVLPLCSRGLHIKERTEQIGHIVLSWRQQPLTLTD